MNENTRDDQPSTAAALERTAPVVLHARLVTSTGGGPDKTILNSPRFLKPLGYDSLCAFFRPPGDPGFQVLRSRAESVSAPLAEIDDRGKMDWRAIRTAIRICKEHQVAIWHAHDYKTNLIGLIARRFHPMKLVTTAHGWVHFAGQTPLYYRLEKRWWLPRYEKVICVSETVLQECLDAGVPQEKCVVIENAIDHEQFCRRKPIDQAKRDLWGAAPEQLVIGAMGRLADEKGFDLLIEAFAQIIAQGIDAKLVIAGEGPDQAILQKQIDETGLADRIQLTGFCQDTRGFFEALDMFVLSSRREGLPNVVLEAMAVGTAVIATRVGGVQRLLEDGVSGRVIDAGNVEQMTAGIQQLAASPELRHRFSAATVQVIADKWSFQKRMRTIGGIYDELLSQ